MATVRKLNFIGRTLYHCGVTPLSCPHSPDGFGVEDVVTRRQPFPWTRDMRRARRRRTMVRKNMGYPDIERARDGQAALRRIIEDYAGPGVDPRAVRRVVDPCRAVRDAIEDDYCREKVRAIADDSAELLAQAEHRPPAAPSGIEFLRQQIRGAL